MKTGLSLLNCAAQQRRQEKQTHSYIRKAWHAVTDTVAAVPQGKSAERIKQKVKKHYRPR